MCLNKWALINKNVYTYEYNVTLGVNPIVNWK